MSLLHQRRVRVSYNRAGFFAPERPWETFCPACDLLVHVPCADVFATWPEAMAWADSHLKLHHCLFCIERQMPAGHDNVLGELFERCPECTAPCTTCDGLAVYPTNYNTPTELVEDLATLRLAPVFCDGCKGVVALIPLDPEILL